MNITEIPGGVRPPLKETLMASSSTKSTQVLVLRERGHAMDKKTHNV